MIFRAENGILYEVDFYGNEEQEKAFVENQNRYSTEDSYYLYVTIDKLPYNPYPTAAFYKLDDQNNIVLDAERMLENFKQETINTINKIRDSMIEKGYTWTNPSDAKQYTFGLSETDKIGLISLATAVNLGQTDNLFFITKDNITVSLTADQVKDLALKTFEYVSYIYYTARMYKDRILQATTIEDILAILEDIENQMNS